MVLQLLEAAATINDAAACAGILENIAVKQEGSKRRSESGRRTAKTTRSILPVPSAHRRSSPIVVRRLPCIKTRSNGCLTAHLHPDEHRRSSSPRCGGKGRPFRRRRRSLPVSALARVVEVHMGLTDTLNSFQQLLWPPPAAAARPQAAAASPMRESVVGLRCLLDFPPRSRCSCPASVDHRSCPTMLHVGWNACEQLPRPHPAASP